MVNFWKKRVINGKALWTEVPSAWKDDVIASLIADGYTLNDDGTVSKED